MLSFSWKDRIHDQGLSNLKSGCTTLFLLNKPHIITILWLCVYSTLKFTCADVYGLIMAACRCLNDVASAKLALSVYAKSDMHRGGLFKWTLTLYRNYSVQLKFGIQFSHNNVKITWLPEVGVITHKMRARYHGVLHRIVWLHVDHSQIPTYDQYLVSYLYVYYASVAFP